ncbi:DUF2845 domain-containing protein [Variovorax terrae]|uniref:DUF2845 domain-containing protein n=1 Tax=Variovorax terrae TaxID=2923278 RepID=A0A9X2AMA1_9BURK|nr:DUF2845 domain-containing protein [Variovorax terrae]MCJ0763503.1 DUF2845 domain-containing protein [Variovorax terrae]
MSRFIVVVACAASSVAIADTRSFRCKNDLIKLGDSKAAALSKCGEPVFKDSFCKKTDPQTFTPSSSPSSSGPTIVVNTACESVDEWTYNPGTGQFMTTLRFESSALTAIRYGDRVQ